jgi:hypothetical protein
MIEQSQLQSDFTGWIDSKQMILGDEISGTGTADARRVADRLKHYITGRAITINRKNRQPYDIPNCTNFIFTSNHPDAFFLENFDRRFFICEGPSAPLADKFYDDIAVWRDKEGDAHLHQHLLNVKLTGFNPFGRAPDTGAKERMVYSSKSGLGAWVSDLTLEDFQITFGQVQLKSELWTSAELRNLYELQSNDKTSHKAITNELAKHGFKQVMSGRPVRLTNGRQVRLWAIKNKKKWANQNASKQIIAHYEKHHSPIEALRNIASTG